MVNPGGHQKSSDNENQREKMTCFSGTQNSISLKLIAKAGPGVLPLLATTTCRVISNELGGTNPAVPQERRGPCVEGIARVSWKLRLQSMSALGCAARGIQQDLKRLHEPRKVIDC